MVAVVVVAAAEAEEVAPVWVRAAVGALHGREALPRRWRDGLLGRTGARDDGRVFELIEAARGRFG